MAQSGGIVKILSVGSATQDVFLRNSNVREKISIDGSTDVSALKMGSKIDLNRVYFSVGGSAVNTATTFARNGIESSMMCSIGQDFAGQNVLKALDSEHIDTSRVVISPIYNTDYTTFLLDGQERAMLAYRGASGRLNCDNLDFSQEEFDWIYVSNLSGHLDLAEKIFQKAKDKNIKIFWNPGKKEFEKPEVVRALAEMVDIFQLNKNEASSLVIGDAAEELLTRCAGFAKIVILTDAENGIWATDRRKILRAGLYEDVPVRDKTGAGDAFGAGFLAQWSRGADLTQSVIYGSANASSVIQYFGSIEGILSETTTLHSMPMAEKDFYYA